MSTKTTRDWYPKEQRTFYLYTYFAQAANFATKVYPLEALAWLLLLLLKKIWMA